MESLPIEIKEQILRELSMCDIIRFKLTSKENYRISSLLYKELQDFYKINKLYPRIKYDIHDFKSVSYYVTYEDVKKNIDLYNKLENDIFSHKKQEIKYNIELWDYNRVTQSNNLTYEQNRIIEFNDIDRKVITIQAYAGTGKSSTMYHFSKKWNDKRILYLTFNNALANETQLKFLDLKNVDVMTTHSLAYDSLNKNILLQNKIGKISREFLRLHCGIKSYKEQTSVIKKIEKYCSSSIKKLNDENIERIWTEIFMHNSTITHDMYLKKFQLSKPKIDYDIIILDEAQDTTPCVLSFLMNQKQTTRIIVGDIHQQIYDFRGVCDPFMAIENQIDNKFYLTKSFRYGFDVCYLSSIIMNIFKNEKKKIETNNKHNTQIYYEQDITKLPQGIVILSRSNMEMFKNLYRFVHLNNDKTIHILGKKYNFSKEIDIIRDLNTISIYGTKVEIKTKKLLNFNNIEDIKEYFHSNSNYKWVHRLKLYEEYGGCELINIYEKISNCIVEKDQADVIITNVHQTKGLEFDNVYLSDDFGKMIYDIRLSYCKKDVFNLLYVAITRAKKRLYINKTIYEFLGRYFSNYKQIIKNDFKQNCHYCTKSINTELITCKFKIPFIQHNLEKIDNVPICNYCFKKQY